MARAIKTVANPDAFVPLGGSSGRYQNSATGEIVSRRTILNTQRGQSVEAYRAERRDAKVTDRDAPNLAQHGQPEYRTGFYQTDNLDRNLHSSARALDALSRVPGDPDQAIAMTIYGKWDENIYRWRSGSGRERSVEPYHWKTVSIRRGEIEEALKSDRDLEKALVNLSHRVPFDPPLDGHVRGITFRGTML